MVSAVKHFGRGKQTAEQFKANLAEGQRLSNAAKKAQPRDEVAARRNKKQGK